MVSHSHSSYSSSRKDRYSEYRHDKADQNRHKSREKRVDQVSQERRTSPSHQGNERKRTYSQNSKKSNKTDGVRKERLYDGKNFQEELTDYVLGRQERIYLPKFTAKNIAFAFSDLGNKEHINYLDNDRILELLTHALSKKPTSQNLAMILLGSGKLAKNAKNHFSERVMPGISEAITRLATLSPNEREISMVVKGLSGFAESGIAFSDKDRVMEAMCKLVTIQAKGTSTQVNIAGTVLGLGRLVENGYTLYPREETANAIYTLIKSLVTLNADSQAIASTILVVGRLVEGGCPFPDKEGLVLSLAALLEGLPQKNPNEQEVSMAVQGLGMLNEQSYKFDEASIGIICNLINQLPQKRPESISIATTILSISKLLEDHTLSEKESKKIMESLTTLTIRLSSQKITTKTIATTILGLGKLAEMKCKFDKADELMRVISTFIQNLAKENPNSSERSLALLGLSKLPEQGYKLYDEVATMKAICTLMKDYDKQKATSKYIAMNVYATGKLVESGYKLDSATVEAVCRFARDLDGKSPNDQQIAMTINGLGKLVEQNYRLDQKERTMRHICTLIKQMSQNSPNSLNISMTIHGVSKLVEQGYKEYIDKESLATLSRLINELPDKNPSAQHIALTVHAAGKFIEHRLSEFCVRVHINAICQLVQLQSDPYRAANEQNIANTILGLSKFIETGYKLEESEKTMQAVCMLVKMLPKACPRSQAICNCILGFSKFLKHSYNLHDEKGTMEALCVLVRKLNDLDSDSLHISNGLLGLSKFVEYGHELHEVDATLSAICKLVISFTKLNPPSRVTANLLLALSRFIEGGYDLKQIATFQEKLIEDLPKKEPNAHSVNIALKALAALAKHKKEAYRKIVASLLATQKNSRFLNVCETLYSLSELEFEDSGLWANRIIKDITCKDQPLTTLPITVKGILGYARLMQQSSDVKAQNAIIWLIKHIRAKVMSVSTILALIQAHDLFEQKKAHEVAKHIDVASLRKLLLTRDPTSEEKALAGITEEREVQNAIEIENAIDVQGGCRLTKETVLLTAMQKPASYDLSTKEGQKALETHLKDQKIEFIAETVPFRIMPIFVIHNELGAVATRDLTPGEYLGKYLGNVVEGSSAIEGSMYAFDITKKEDGPEFFIDARYKRNFAAFLNHSSHFNISTTNKDDGIHFSVFDDPIKKDEQCFITYGDDFFPMLGFNPLYLDRQDSWESFDQLVLQNKEAYLNTSAYVTSELQTAFRLPTQKMLLTKLSGAILTGNEEEALKLVDSQADLWNYCVDGSNRIMAPQTQQRITPIMLACFYGQTRVVKALLKKANLHKRLLQTGETAATFALKGKAEDRASLFTLLYQHGIYYDETNREGEHFLNIAVAENIPEVVDLLFKGKPHATKTDLLNTFAASSKDSMYEAIISGKMDALRTLLNYTSQKWLAPKIVDREILILKALEETEHFDKALSLLMEAGDIHKNFAVVEAMISRFGKKAQKLVETALKAKQWLPKERKVLEEALKVQRL